MKKVYVGLLDVNGKEISHASYSRKKVSIGDKEIKFSVLTPQEDWNYIANPSIKSETSWGVIAGFFVADENGKWLEHEMFEDAYNMIIGSSLVINLSWSINMRIGKKVVNWGHSKEELGLLNCLSAIIDMAKEIKQ